MKSHIKQAYYIIKMHVHTSLSVHNQAYVRIIKQACGASIKKQKIKEKKKNGLK